MNSCMNKLYKYTWMKQDMKYNSFMNSYMNKLYK